MAVTVRATSKRDTKLQTRCTCAKSIAGRSASHACMMRRVRAITTRATQTSDRSSATIYSRRCLELRRYTASGILAIVMYFAETFACGSTAARMSNATGTPGHLLSTATANGRASRVPARWPPCAPTPPEYTQSEYRMCMRLVLEHVCCRCDFVCCSCDLEHVCVCACVRARVRVRVLVHVRVRAVRVCTRELFPNLKQASGCEVDQRWYRAMSRRRSNEKAKQKTWTSCGAWDHSCYHDLETSPAIHDGHKSWRGVEHGRVSVQPPIRHWTAWRDHLRLLCLGTSLMLHNGPVLARRRTGTKIGASTFFLASMPDIRTWFPRQLWGRMRRVC